MTKRFCDLCGEEITSWSRNDKTKWKMKYFYDKPFTTQYSYGKALTYGRGWCLIDAREVCLRAVAKKARLHGVEMKGGEK